MSGLEAEIDFRLVRGLDYYTRTTFEFQSEALGAAQNAVGGGGRYDGLVEQIGGPPTPGVGFGSGLERIALAMQDEATAGRQAATPTSSATTTRLARGVRARPAPAPRAAARGRSRPGRAQRQGPAQAGRRAAGADVAVLLGLPDVPQPATCAVRLLAGGQEQDVAVDDLVSWFQARQAGEA